MEEKELTLSINEGVGCGERNGRDSFQCSNTIRGAER